MSLVSTDSYCLPEGTHRLGSREAKPYPPSLGLQDLGQGVSDGNNREEGRAPGAEMTSGSVSSTVLATCGAKLAGSVIRSLQETHPYMHVK